MLDSPDIQGDWSFCLMILADSMDKTIPSKVTISGFWQQLKLPIGWERRPKNWQKNLFTFPDRD
jgi:hypothetical protein